MEFIKEPGVEIIKKWKRVKEKNIAIAVSEEENGYCYTGEWACAFPQGYVEANSEEEAIEFAKSYVSEHGADENAYIYRAKKYWN